MRKIYDSLTNLLAQVGTGKGKESHTTYVNNIIPPDQLTAAYDTAWLPAKIVDIPARDAVREWRTWDNPEIEAEEVRLSLRRRVLQALTAARIRGGSAIYIDTGTRTPNNPLGDDEKIERLALVPADNIQWPEKPLTIFDPANSIFTVDQTEVHTSRLALFHGVPPVDGDYGFGKSVLNRAWQAIKNADSVPAAVAELVWEAKLDIYKIPDFLNNLGDPGYENKMLRRFQLANNGKSIVNAIVMDSNEEYEQKQVGFADLANLILTVYQVAAGAADIPVTRLLGQSASGLNSSGDNEVRDYYDTIKAMQTLQISAALSSLDKHIGKGASYEWRPLWQPTAKEQSEALKSNTDAIVALIVNNVIPSEVLTEPATALLEQYLPGLQKALDEYTQDFD